MKTVIWSVRLIWFIWLVSSNQINKTNHTNQTNETDQMRLTFHILRVSRSSARPKSFFCSLLDRRKVANNDLGNFLKIAVRCQNREPVLHSAGGNPDIVGGNWGAGPFQEGRDDGPSIRSFVVDCENAHSGRLEKAGIPPSALPRRLG